MEARADYERGREASTRAVAALEARSRRVATVRLALVAGALGLLLWVVWGHAGASGWAGLALAVAAFVAFVLVHARIHDALERASATLRFHERGLARIAHAWDRLPSGSARFRSAHHPFAGDLDVFGRASLMQLADATETRFGEERLAHLLSLESPGTWPGDVVERQDAVRELAERFALRESLATAGGVLAAEKPDPTPIVDWAEAEGTLAPALKWFAWVVPVATLAAVTAGPSVFGSGATSLSFLAAVAVGLPLAQRLTPMLSAVSSREGALTRWRGMIEVLERESFTSPLLVRLQERFIAGGRRASSEIGALERIVSFADARRNEVFRFLIGPVLMWDVHCASALVRWRERAGKHVRGWLEALGELEALASLASFAFENADFAWPEATDAATFQAEGLGHPLIAAERRVGNDVRMEAAGRALVVTGSNMSGKSTLLRAIGANAVLAYAGAPVCARALKVGPCRVVTSVRIEDSLEEGVSHFYAELTRLKSVLDIARQPGAAALFLLDEILHGTNSRERVIGACAIVRQLLACGALGAVTTHDLGITALEQELGGKVENVHFEEQVEGDKMTFDYRLRPGVVQSSNALRLMRALGILGDGA